MNALSVRALDCQTWKDFERLAERHNGVWGGCWCTWFHRESPAQKQSPEANKAHKKRLVEQERSHAALVYEEDRCVAWCQFGPPQELPNIYHKKEVEAKVTLPDWRITCIFVDKNYRKRGLSLFAVTGALQLIRDSGGGVVESYPQETHGRRVSNSLLYNGTMEIFERAGFSYVEKKGKNHCIMRRTI